MAKTKAETASRALCAKYGKKLILKKDNIAHLALDIAERVADGKIPVSVAREVRSLMKMALKLQGIEFEAEEPIPGRPRSPASQPEQPEQVEAELFGELEEDGHAMRREEAEAEEAEGRKRQVA